MKRFLTVALCMLLVLSSLSPAFAEETTTVPNATYFYNIEPDDVMKSEESQVEAAVMAMLYVTEQKDDTICKEFVEAFQNNWGDMKVAIGGYKKNFTIIAIAFRNGEFYCFEVTHYPIFSLTYDDAYIDVTKIEKQTFYDSFDVVLSNMEEQKKDKTSSLDLKFTKLTSYSIAQKLIEIIDNGKK